jgi:hypothetical protein
MALRLADARRRVIVLLSQYPEGELLGESRARELQIRMRLADAEMQQLLGHLLGCRVLEYVGPSPYDVRLSDEGRVEANP